MSRKHQGNENPYTMITAKVNAVLEEERNSNSSTASTSTTSSSSNKHGLDLWQPRDWPHRRGDEISLNLHSIPLDDDSSGKRAHPCESCHDSMSEQACKTIHDNVLCWKCKAAFCMRCFVQQPGAMFLFGKMKMEKVLKDGFGKCPYCSEPLRSMGLATNTRQLAEPMSRTHLESHGHGMGMVRGDEAVASLMEMFGAMDKESGNPKKRTMHAKEGQSLVQEAEEALQRAQSLRDTKNNSANKTKAIDEYTHAINAINLFASLSKGAGLVLRPHDLLLICHYERAVLEGNKKLANAILKAYPKASVRNNKEESQFSISRSGFSSLFYPLPGCLLVGSPNAAQSPSSPSNGDTNGTGLLCVDLRTDLKQRGQKGEIKEQIRLVGDDGIPNLEQFIKEQPNCDGTDNNYNNLRGIWKGVLSYILPNKSTAGPVLQVEGTRLSLARFVQFVRAFPTATAAAEYTRIIFETKTIGEEEAPISAENDRRLAKNVKKKYKSLLAASADMTTGVLLDPCRNEGGTIELRQVHVLQGQSVTSIVAALGNVSTKILVDTGHDSGSSSGCSDNNKAVCVVLARAFVYLHHRLENCRATTTSPTVRELDDEEIVHCADLTLCAYCGKNNSEEDVSSTNDGAGRPRGRPVLKGCTRCKAVKYCNVDCQRNHWEMQGPNSHKTLCKSAKKLQRKRQAANN